jgi:hypothetical protein
MATSSFDEMMVIDTPEAARNLEAAYRAAEKRGPLKFEGPGIDEMLRRGEESLKRNINKIKEAAAKARALAEQNEEEIADLSDAY